MINIQLDFPDRDRLAQAPERLRWALGRYIAREAQESARDMKQEMARQRIAATSLLINSVQASALGPLAWRAGPQVAYARYVLEGRKPGGGMPPWQSIMDWLKTKRLGFDRQTAWAVARAIQRRGIRARDYLTPVVERTAARIEMRAVVTIQAALDGDNVG